MGIMKPVFSSVFGPTIPDVNWIPNSLFALAEPGVWYDPSDITTLFQDNFGVTPVTTAGQTVGMMLDKSQGLVLGSELIVNGSFATDTNWTKGTGWTISGGSANSLLPNNLQTLTQVRAFPAGTYRISFTISNYIAGQLAARFSGGGSDSASSVLANGTYSFLLTATAARTQIDFLTTGGTGFTGSIDDISVKLLAGTHASQATLAQRPTYQVDGTGRPYLSFDGVDDGMVTRTITPAIDKVQVFAGLRKLSDAAIGVVFEHSAVADTNNGALNLRAPNSAAAASFAIYSRGTTTVAVGTTASTNAAPVTKVVSGILDISAPRIVIRLDGTQVATSVASQGTGNYLAYPLYIGRRGGTTLPFNGRIYSLITRFGANLTTQQITSTETYVNGKTGAY